MTASALGQKEHVATNFSILTVCTGNIHRSPLAAALLQTWSRWYLPAQVASEVRVRSAGFAAPVGAPMGARVQVVAAMLGADGSAHTATRITDDLIAESDLVLVASRRQRDEVLARVPSALRATFTVREAGRIAAALTNAASPPAVRHLADTVARMADLRGDLADPAGDDVIDPQGRDVDAYVQMTREEVVALAHLARPLLGMPAADVRAYISAAEDEAALRVALEGTDSR